MKQNTFFSAKNVATLGILLALVIVLQVYGGALNIGVVSLNFSLIPIVLGALVLGEIAGGILGLACGIVILIQVIIAPAGFYYIIWTESPFITICICILKTTVAGYVSGLLFKVLSKRNGIVATFVASGIVPVINTTLFVLGCLCMSGTIQLFQESIGMTADNVLIFTLVVLVTFNFFFEFAINLLLAPAIKRVYDVVEKQFTK